MNIPHSTSSNKWTSPIFPFHHVSNWQVLTNEKFLQSFYNCLISVIPRVSGQELSPKGFVFIKCNSRQPFPPVKLHYPQSESDPFLSKELGYPVVISIKSPLSSCIHNCIACIHRHFITILGPKWCTLYLSLFDPSNQRFHLQIFGRRNLNRGICHTPIFDLRYHRHVLFNLDQSRPF